MDSTTIFAEVANNNANPSAYTRPNIYTIALPQAEERVKCRVLAPCPDFVSCVWGDDKYATYQCDINRTTGELTFTKWAPFAWEKPMRGRFFHLPPGYTSLVALKQDLCTWFAANKHADDKISDAGLVPTQQDAELDTRKGRKPTKVPRGKRQAVTATAAPSPLDDGSL